MHLSGLLEAIHAPVLACFGALDESIGPVPSPISTSSWKTVSSLMLSCISVSAERQVYSCASLEELVGEFGLFVHAVRLTETFHANLSESSVSVI